MYGIDMIFKLCRFRVREERMYSFRCDGIK